MLTIAIPVEKKNLIGKYRFFLLSKAKCHFSRVYLLEILICVQHENSLIARLYAAIISFCISIIKFYIRSTETDSFKNHQNINLNLVSIIILFAKFFA